MDVDGTSSPTLILGNHVSVGQMPTQLHEQFYLSPQDLQQQQIQQQLQQQQQQQQLTLQQHHNMYASQRGQPQTSPGVSLSSLGVAEQDQRQVVGAHVASFGGNGAHIPPIFVPNTLQQQHPQSCSVDDLSVSIANAVVFVVEEKQRKSARQQQQLEQRELRKLMYPQSKKQSSRARSKSLTASASKAAHAASKQMSTPAKQKQSRGAAGSESGGNGKQPHDALYCRAHDCGYATHECSQCGKMQANASFGFFKQSMLRKRQGDCCKAGPREIYSSKKIQQQQQQQQQQQASNRRTVQVC